jgi:hypothetical protein
LVLTREGEPVHWDVPIWLSSRLCWTWKGTRYTIPVVNGMAQYTDERRNDPNEFGFMVDLPSENGVTVSVTYDPQPDYPVSEQVSIHIDVRHPDHGELCDAWIERAEFSDGVRYWVEYDPLCAGAACDREGCSCRVPKAWMEFVTDGPPQIMERLAWLGSLPIRLPNLARVRPGGGGSSDG